MRARPWQPSMENASSGSLSAVQAVRPFVSFGKIHGHSCWKLSCHTYTHYTHTPTHTHTHTLTHSFTPLLETGLNALSQQKQALKEQEEALAAHIASMREYLKTLRERLDEDTRLREDAEGETEEIWNEVNAQATKTTQPPTINREGGVFFLLLDGQQKLQPGASTAWAGENSRSLPPFPHLSNFSRLQPRHPTPPHSVPTAPPLRWKRFASCSTKTAMALQQRAAAQAVAAQSISHSRTRHQRAVTRRLRPPLTSRAAPNFANRFSRSLRAQRGRGRAFVAQGERSDGGGGGNVQMVEMERGGGKSSAHTHTHSLSQCIAFLQSAHNACLCLCPACFQTAHITQAAIARGKKEPPPLQIAHTIPSTCCDLTTSSSNSRCTHAPQSTGCCCQIANPRLAPPQVIAEEARVTVSTAAEAAAAAAEQQ